MSEFNPCIVKIEKIIKHPNADNLSIATVLGDYPVIIKTGQYNEGDLAAYVCIDAIVPDIADWFFLCPKQYEQYEENGEFKQKVVGPKYQIGNVPEKYRIIKAKRLRGIYSQGLLIDAPPELKLGDSIVEAFSLKKWEEENEENIPGIKKIRGANAASPPKGWAIPYYDIEGMRKYLNCLKDDEEIVLTEKINGANFSACYDGEQLFVKSRNYYKKRDEDDMWWDAAIRYNLEEKLKKYPMFVFFAEVAGRVAKYKYTAQIVDGKLNTILCFFDIYDVKQNKYLDYDDFLAIMKELDLPTVPELYRGIWKGKAEMYPYAEGKTTLGGNGLREGFVCRTVKERYEPKLDARMQVKLIGEGYTLSK